jgi:putative transposase
MLWLRPFRFLTIVTSLRLNAVRSKWRRVFVPPASSKSPSRVVKRRDGPAAIRYDQGTEFTAEALDQWAYANKIELDFSRPGKPTDHASRLSAA